VTSYILRYAPYSTNGSQGTWITFNEQLYTVVVAVVTVVVLVVLVVADVVVTDVVVIEVVLVVVVAQPDNSI
jgi:hypothetical protein